MKKLLLFLGLIAVGVVGIVFVLSRNGEATANQARVGKVDRGTITEKISATGKLAPKNVAFVGIDVQAAIVRKISEGADIGKQVTQGQELVELDDTLTFAKLKEAEALVLAAEAAKKRAEAGEDAARVDSQAAESAHEDATDAHKSAEKIKNPDLEKTAKIRLREAERALKRADAQLKERQGSVKAAQADLARAQAAETVVKKAHELMKIKAPISGIIIDRKVMNSQIVTPQTTPYLFLIAPDLDQMQVLANVGESDINKIKKGMKAAFSVDAYSEEGTRFESQVADKALIPAVAGLRSPGSGLSLSEVSSAISGPVFYPVTLDVTPVKGKSLQPGLTANLDFIVQEVKDVLRVPNQSLTYRPEKLTAEEQRKIDEGMAKDAKPVWVRAGGRTQVVLVKTGATDGAKTEIVPVDGELSEGMEVVTEGPPKKAGLFDQPVRVGL